MSIVGSLSSAVGASSASHGTANVSNQRSPPSIMVPTIAEMIAKTPSLPALWRPAP
jgi:hypothetical protein